METNGKSARKDVPVIFDDSQNEGTSIRPSSTTAAISPMPAQVP